MDHLNKKYCPLLDFSESFRYYYYGVWRIVGRNFGICIYIGVGNDVGDEVKSGDVVEVLL